MTTVVTVGSEQAAGGEAMDGWMLFLAIVSAIGAVTAAIAGVVSVILTRRGNKVQDRQLQLQEELAAMIPHLKVSDIRFLNPRNSEKVMETLREMQQKKREDGQASAEEERRKQKSAEWEAISDPVRHARRHYRGPTPNAVLVFQIKNEGKTAAHDISGTLQLEAAYLVPLDFPGMDIEKIAGREEGFYQVNLPRITELLPGHTVEYQIALQAANPGGDNKVRIKYDVTPAHGISLTGKESVELVSSSPR